MAYDPLNSEQRSVRSAGHFHGRALHPLRRGIRQLQIEWRVERDADGNSHGFWCCPMPGCDGKGFGFDIFPVDPEYRDENGELMWCSDDGDDDEDEFDDDEFDDEAFAEFDELDDEDEEEEDWLLDDEAPSRGPRPAPDEDIPF